MTRLSHRIEIWPVERLKPYDRNARTHSPEQVAKIAASLAEFGFVNPVLVDSADGIIAGHGRMMAARSLGLTDVPVIVLDHLTDAQRRAYILADNKLAELAGWDVELLSAELLALDTDGFDLGVAGWSTEELDALLGDGLLPDNQNGNGGDGSGANDNTPDGQPSGMGSLAARFMLPPFTVMSAREGWWQDRKRAWLALGIVSEVGRGADMLQLGAAEERMGMSGTNGTSIFDPVLCEIAYRWFSPPTGIVLDPFAGGSVRGIVASKLGRQYVGHELRGEQVDANREQGAALCAGDAQPPRWIEGDSRMIDQTCKHVQADLIFSCPPYADLEVYSDDPADLSTLGYGEFVAAYREIIAKACARLREDRFAVFVVGEVRDKRGNYLDFVGDTVQAFRDAGLHYYNEAILVTAVGSLPIRAGRQFAAGRKLGKTHQNVLVFVKGDGKRAAQACGEVEMVDVIDTAEAA